MVIDMFGEELKVRYPNMDLSIHPNSLHVIKDNDRMVLKIGFFGDYMTVWRCVPRYESEPEKLFAADPDFIDKIFEVMEGKRAWN